MKQRLVLYAGLLAALLGIAACGGGGGNGSQSTPTAKAWGTAQLIQSDARFALQPQIAVDGSGNAIAVWVQVDTTLVGTRNNIWANRFSAASGTWGTAQLIEDDNAGSAFDPQIAFDGSGNALAVWEQSDGTRNNIWANRFSAGSGTWGTADFIESDAGFAGSPQIAFDGSGDALAVWAQSDGTRQNIWANRFSAASGTWGTAELIETDNAGSAFQPQIAFDGSGNALAVWYQSDGTRTNIWANRFNANSGTWGTADLIESEAGRAESPQIAVDGSGNAIAVWQQDEGTPFSFNIWANRFSAASGTWGTAQLIENENTGNALNSQVAVDASGNALAVWSQDDGTRRNIRASRFSASNGAWSAAQLIETDDAGGAFAPQIAFDGSGNAIAVWSQDDGTLTNIRANRFSADSGAWGAAQLIGSDDAGNGTESPQIAVNGSGTALAVWRQFEGTVGNIWANRFE